MTQLVELQEALPKFQAARIQLYAVSYDEPDALAEFAEHHGITFPLLSDVGSVVIRRFGILNDLISKDQVPGYGIPFPGAYVLDEDGVVVEKFFNRHWDARSSAESMIDGALGEILLSEAEPNARGGMPDITISATYHGGGGKMKLAAVRHLVVRFELAPGLHIYDAPVPDGMVATRIAISGPPGLHIEPVVKPPTSPLVLPGLGTALQVWEGTVDFAVPLWADDQIVSFIREKSADHHSLDGAIDYQACDDTACRIPQRETLSVRIPIAGHVGPKLSGMPLEMAGSIPTAMNTTKYMARMTARGLRRSPIKGARNVIAEFAQALRGPGRKKRS